ncbi:MAG TPA: hypothetical protein VK563_15040 [Puia sp.]|nr:hypothetical protein [Puia sp.]
MLSKCFGLRRETKENPAGLLFKGKNLIHSGMAEPLSPIQKLDIVLTAISVDPRFRSARETFDLIRRPEIELSEIKLILDKLEKDRFATHDYNDDADRNIRKKPTPIYKISFEGKYFIIEKGGYLKRHQDQNLRRRKIEIENSQNQLNQILLVIGAFGAAVGAIGLVVWEVYKYSHLENH